MTAFTGFLVETIGASIVLVSVGVAGTKLMVGKLLSRDLELHKMRLKEASEVELARMRADAEKEARKPNVPAAQPPQPVATAPVHDRTKVTGELFQLFDDATLGIVRFALEFRAENHQAADEAGRAAIETSSRLSNFVRLHTREFGKAARGSIEAVSAPLSELAWRSYRIFKDPALSEKQTAQEIESLNKETMALGARIETLKMQLAALLENESLP